MLQDMINGTTKLITAASDDTITPAEHRGAAIVIGSVSAIAMGMFTRKRVNEGKDPIAGFIA